MKKNVLNIGILSLGLVMSSCGGNQDGNKNEEDKVEVTDSIEENQTVNKSFPKDAITQNGITIYKAEIAQEFPDAKLKLLSPETKDVKAAGTQTFKYSVEDYELAKQTPGADDRHCANSQEGQHIHFIVNNGPYSAQYKTSFDADLAAGNNVVLSFLSRSYHESIKNKTAFTFVNYKIGETSSEFDMDADHLFYSRPKGTYSGKDAKKILLDFYLVNTEISEDGNKVKASINGNDFVLDEWAPYFVEGLKEGENTFRIQLIDKDGNLVPGPFNDSGDRTITLENMDEMDMADRNHVHDDMDAHDHDM